MCVCVRGLGQRWLPLTRCGALCSVNHDGAWGTQMLAEVGAFLSGHVGGLGSGPGALVLASASGLLPAVGLTVFPSAL